MIKLLFFSSFALLVYAYFLYPFILMLLPKVKSYQSSGANTFPTWPSISVLLAAYNEAAVIQVKIKNFLNCIYPGQKELVIVSDGSTDGTKEAVEPLRSDTVRFLEQSPRQGKGSALRKAVSVARGEVLVFTDANTIFDELALVELVRPMLMDSTIGLVTGVTRYPGNTLGSIYQRYEQLLKRLENKLGVVATADGAIYAIRRSLLEDHDPRLINDFFHPIMVNLKGFSATIAPSAICFEDFSIQNEFARQVRMVSQATLVYFTALPHMAKARCWRTLFVLTSHKFLRWLTMPLLLIFTIATLCLRNGGAIYQAAFFAEGMIACLALLGFVATRFGLDERISFVYRFITLNVAGALGLGRGLWGEAPIIWEPRSK